MKEFFLDMGRKLVKTGTAKNEAREPSLEPVGIDPRLEDGQAG
jgi:hypothetical protein